MEIKQRGPYRNAPKSGELRGPYQTYTCRTCGKEFRRREWSKASREYCTPAHEKRDFQVGDRVRVVLNAEVIDVSRDKLWILLSSGNSAMWVPIDKFVEKIQEHPAE